MKHWTYIATLCAVLISSVARAEEPNWWPKQAAPKAIVSTIDGTDFEPVKYSTPRPKGLTRLPVSNMVLSISGLAAKAVNEGRCDEMVWLNSTNLDYRDWRRRAIRRLKLEDRGTFAPWDLVDRYVKNGVIKGYILYRYDYSDRGMSEHRKGMDNSVNVATSVAGILDGILIEEGQEETAKHHGLKLLLDVREKSQQWCFDTYKDQFCRTMLCTQDPKKPDTRDLAIAQKAFMVYGYDEPVPAALEWLEPLSPILGWNGGDEGKTTSMTSVWGHIQTATDWCINLPIMMAGADKAEIPVFKSLQPAAIDWKDKRAATSFVLSDGDNVQWYTTGFARGQENSFWTSPDRGKMSFGWSDCFTHLVQLSPDILTYLKETERPNDWFIEWGGGYYYPEQFAKERPNRYELLAKQARRTAQLMAKTGTRVIGFNFHDLDSPDAMKAYEIFAREMDGIVGILAFKYDPYEGGAGKVYWAKDKSGREIPIVTARYSVWSDVKRPRSGTPAKVAREMRETADAAGKDDQVLNWVIVHCWSYFKKSSGSNEKAEEMKQKTAARSGGVRGYTSALWTAKRLRESIRVVPIEEIIWRARMNHNPGETAAAMEAIKK